MSSNIGNTYYSDPRAVQIAGKYLEGGEPDDKTPHSAVHGDFNFLTNSFAEAQALMNAWPEIMQNLHDMAQKILEAIPKSESPPGE